MSRKLLSIEVAGCQKRWSFQFYGDPRHLEDWLADGLDVAQVVNTIPGWLPSWVPVRWWCAAQDLFNFKRPGGSR